LSSFDIDVWESIVWKGGWKFAFNCLTETNPDIIAHAAELIANLSLAINWGENDKSEQESRLMFELMKEWIEDRWVWVGVLSFIAINMEVENVKKILMQNIDWFI